MAVLQEFANDIASVTARRDVSSLPDNGRQQ